MATKKQKHLAALEKRERYMTEVKRTGLEAQKKDREHRLHKLLEATKDVHEKDHSWKKIDPSCPHCQHSNRLRHVPGVKKPKTIISKGPRKGNRRIKENS